MAPPAKTQKTITLTTDDHTTTSTTSSTTAPDRYGQALEELEDLLEELEDADLDVDHLAERVARGVELVRFCRDRLAVVTNDVDQVVAELAAAEDELHNE